MTYNDLLTEISDIRKISVAMKNSPVINTKLEMFGLYTEDIVRLIKKYKEIDLSSFELDKYYEINYIYIAIGLIQNKNIEKHKKGKYRVCTERKNVLPCCSPAVRAADFTR